jgi:hypothetical protein
MSFQLLRRVERYLKKTRTPPTRFGWEAARDPKLVSDLRGGRQPRRQLEARIHAFIDEREKMMEAIRCGRR